MLSNTTMYNLNVNSDKQKRPFRLMYKSRELLYAMIQDKELIKLKVEKIVITNTINSQPIRKEKITPPINLITNKHYNYENYLIYSTYEYLQGESIEIVNVFNIKTEKINSKKIGHIDGILETGKLVQLVQTEFGLLVNYFSLKLEIILSEIFEEITHYERFLALVGDYFTVIGTPIQNHFFIWKNKIIKFDKPIHHLEILHLKHFKLNDSIYAFFDGSYSCVNSNYDDKDIILTVKFKYIANLTTKIISFDNLPHTNKLTQLPDYLNENETNIKLCECPVIVKFVHCHTIIPFGKFNIIKTRTRTGTGLTLKINNKFQILNSNLEEIANFNFEAKHTFVLKKFAERQVTILCEKAILIYNF